MGALVKPVRPIPARIQVCALATATTRQLVWGLRAVSREVGRWRALAQRIPDAALREDALAALADKRGNVDGAALFWTLAPVRRPGLLRLLVAYEVMCDFLDSTSERGAYAGLRNGRQLHLAFSEALDPGTPISDYYRHHPWCEDGGYLLRLVQACRTMCVRLPSYRQVGPTLLCAARRAQVQGLNHEPDPVLRDNTLRNWTDSEFYGFSPSGGSSPSNGFSPSNGLSPSGGSFPSGGLLPSGLEWFELSGSASTWISVLALLSLASSPGRGAQDARDTYSAYFWVCLAATMLDSYVDEAEDLANGDHSYFNHYRSRERGIVRTGEIVTRAAYEVGALRDGDRHMVIIACMISLYLSKDSALAPATAAASRVLLRAGGPLAMLLWPILRAWRRAYALGAA